MECPNCGKNNTTITDTRNKGGKVKRRRKCLDCNTMFSTVEKLDNDLLFVTGENFKKRGKFKREKLLSSMMKAAYDSNVSAKEINDFIDEIEYGEKRDYKTEEIFNKVCEFFKKIDRKAYIRYAVKRKDFILK